MVVQYPLWSLQGVAAFFHSFFFPILIDLYAVFQEALVDSGVNRISGGRLGAGTQAHNLIVKEIPAFLGTRVDFRIGVHIGVCGSSVNAVRNSACVCRSAQYSPCLRIHWNLLYLWSGCSRNMTPVPYREDVEVFISRLYDVGTSVGHEIGLQVFLIAIFTFLGTGRSQTYIEVVLRAYMQRVIATEIMGMRCRHLIVGRLFAVQPGNDGLVFLGMGRVNVNHAFGIGGSGSFVQQSRTAYAASYHIERHVLSAHGTIISFTHEFAEQLHLFLAEFILCA